MPSAHSTGDSVQISRHPDGSKAYLLQATQWLPRPLKEVFAFFADAGNLEAITPPWLNFQVLTPQPIEMHAGALIDYRLRLHQIPIRWRTEISAWDPPYRFIDQQLKGPYRIWIHEHTFQSVDNGTEVLDNVKYSVPGGPLVHRLLVRGDLQRIFNFRQKKIRELLGVNPE